MNLACLVAFSQNSSATPYKAHVLSAYCEIKEYIFLNYEMHFCFEMPLMPVNLIVVHRLLLLLNFKQVCQFFDVHFAKLQSATIYPPVVSSGKPLMPSEVSLELVMWNIVIDCTIQVGILEPSVVCSADTIRSHTTMSAMYFNGRG